MIHRNELATYLADFLSVDTIKDYCPNGLQVAGRDLIKKIVTGVSASLPLLQAAIDSDADAILVHHGYFWKNENPTITGIKQARIKLLLEHDINLLAYHLPLDVHPDLGNNKQLADHLGLQAIQFFDAGGVKNLLAFGELNEPLSASDFGKLLELKLQREALHISGDKLDDSEIKKIAWCTGAAQDLIEEAVLLGADAFVTGEVSERTVLIAREAGIHFYAAGHHATERYGVKALGEHLAQRFGVLHENIDIDNPV